LQTYNKDNLEIVPHSRPSISDKDIDCVCNALASLQLAQGSRVEQFEKKLCAFLVSKKETPLQGVAVSSGTVALFLALYSLDVKPSDEIIIPTYACSAILNAVYRIGATPVLVDVDPDTWNIDYESVVASITSKTKAIIVTHTFGVPAKINRFVAMGIPIIEDCAQSIGATVNGDKVGTFGTISVFSFYATKMLTTGQGGMVVSCDSKIIGKIRDYREFDCRKTYYPRFNFQTTDFQAALGLSQLERLDRFITKRRSLAGIYRDAICGKENVDWQRSFEGTEPNYYRFVLKLRENSMEWFNAMRKNGIECVRPIEPYELLHRYLALDYNDFPVAEKIAKISLSVPMFPGLKEMQIEKIRNALFLQCNRDKC
jgi:perosamine synthetase